jgi:branched-subunit amino acid transport protein
MTWLLIFGMALITFVNRYAFFTQWIQYQPSQKVRRFLSYSSYSILTAIWAPIIFNVNHQTGFSHAGMDYLIATTVAIVFTMLKLPSIIVVLVSTSVFFGMRFLL